MSAVTLAPVATTLPTRTVLGRAVAAEWTRVWSVRSTWVALAASVAITAFVAVAFGVDVRRFESAVPVWSPGEGSMQVVQFPLLVIAMLAVTADQASGAVRATLRAVPRRGVLLTARVVVTVGLVVAAGVLLQLLSAALSAVALGDAAVVVPADVARSLLGTAGMLASAALLTVGLATVLRSSAGTMTTLFLVLVMVPNIAPQFEIAWLTWVGLHQLGAVYTGGLHSFALPLGVGEAMAVVAVWLVGVTTAAFLVLTRRDAT